MAKTTKVETPVITKSHETIVNKLKENGFNKFDGGIQLFTDQFKDYYNISINYMGTGVKVHGTEIDESELIDNSLIKICKTFECVI